MGVYLETTSTIDGAPLWVGATLTSTNRKTGLVVQTYIIRSDVPPTEAARSGLDASVCGDCVHRPTLAKAAGAARCYVNLGHGPRAVWGAIARGSYMRVDAHGLGGYCAGRFLRLGSYGDPGAVAAELWHPALEACAAWTGYTHRWRDTGRELRGVCMASVDSPAERDEARAAGWSTFRVARGGTDEARARGEARCPASVEAGARVQCVSCPIACNGMGLSVSILDHGPGGIARRLA